MRAPDLLLLGLLLLVAVPGAAPQAGENPDENRLADLAPASRAAIERYRQETMKRLMELDTIMDWPPDKPDEGAKIYRYIYEEDAEELAAAFEVAREAELKGGDEAQEVLDWLDKQHEFAREQWGYIAGEGALWYYRNCEMTQRLQDFLKAEEYIDAFSAWFAGFARSLDNAVAAGRRALKSGSRADREAALAVCRQQVHAANLLDEVWGQYQEKFEEVIENIEKDEYGDVDTWWDDWDLDEEEAPELCAHKRKWKELVDQNYEALREAEGDAVALMKPVLDGTFMHEHSFQEIGDWLAGGGLGEPMEWLVADLEKSLR